MSSLVTAVGTSNFAFHISASRNEENPVSRCMVAGNIIIIIIIIIIVIVDVVVVIVIVVVVVVVV